MKVSPVTLNSKVLIREATVQDAEQVLHHTRTVSKETNFLLTTTEEMAHFTKEFEENWIQGHVNKPNWLLLVAEDEGNIVGLLSFRTSESIRAAHRGLFGISIRQEWTNKGIGKEMIQMMLHWTERNPEIEKVCLEVFSHNASAIYLYQKLGFEQEGFRKDHVKFSEGTYADEILMFKFVK